jgi:glycosyltransferase involved in cell wall biosynthesis
MARTRNPVYHEPLTIIIPVRNGAETIERCIQSACNSGADSVLVFDDGSTDKTFELLSDWFETEKYPQLEYFAIGEFRAGVVFARNYLVENADMGLIVPLDCDDTIRSVKPFKDAFTPDCWLYGDYNEHDGATVNQIKSPPPGTLSRKNLCMATCCFHKSAWEAAKGYDVDFAFAEDWSFQCALTNAGIQPKHIDAVVYDRYIHPKGNERTAKANAYFSFYQALARSKYPSVFRGT